MSVSLPVRVTAAIQGLRNSVSIVAELSYESSEARDLLIEELETIAAAALSLSCVFKSLQLRVEAGQEIEDENRRRAS